MSRGAVDLSLGYISDLDGAGIMVQRLVKHPCLCLYSSKHSFIHDSLDRAAFLAADHVALKGIGHDQESFETIIAQAAPERRIAYRSHHFMHIQFIIRETDLVATVPRAVAFAFMGVDGI